MKIKILNSLLTAQFMSASLGFGLPVKYKIPFLYSPDRVDFEIHYEQKTSNFERVLSEEKDISAEKLEIEFRDWQQQSEKIREEFQMYRKETVSKIITTGIALFVISALSQAPRILELFPYPDLLNMPELNEHESKTIVRKERKRT